MVSSWEGAGALTMTGVRAVREGTCRNWIDPQGLAGDMRVSRHTTQISPTAARQADRGIQPPPIPRMITTFERRPGILGAEPRMPGRPVQPNPPTGTASDLSSQRGS
jgi:hypothetical protein